MTDKDRKVEEIEEEEISPEKLEEIRKGFESKKKHFGPEELYK